MAGRRELTEGSLTAGACEGLQGSGWKQKEHSRWVRGAAASEVGCVVICGGELPGERESLELRSHLDAEAFEGLLPAPAVSSYTKG